MHLCDNYKQGSFADKINRPFRIGITGGIGSGKSVVSRILRCNGYKVYDCDYEAKRIMTESRIVKSKLNHILGSSIYDEKGRLDKKYLADLIFSDERIRSNVNSVVHEAVRNDIDLKARSMHGLFFIESAILGSSGLSDSCDFIWLVEAPEDMRISRIAKRNGMSKDEIVKRMLTQAHEISLLQHDKINVILNDGTHSVIDRIIKLLNNIK